MAKKKSKKLGRPATRGNRKGVVIYLPVTLKNAFKAYSEKKGISMTDIAEGLISKLVHKN